MREKNIFIPDLISTVWRQYCLPTVWPDWMIFCTLGNHSKPVATIILPKSPTLVGNFCKGVKIIHFSSGIILGNFYRHLEIFIWSHCQPMPSKKVLFFKTNWPTSAKFLFISNFLFHHSIDEKDYQIKRIKLNHEKYYYKAWIQLLSQRNELMTHGSESSVKTTQLNYRPHKKVTFANDVFKLSLVIPKVS